MLANIPNDRAEASELLGAISEFKNANQ